MVVAIVVRHEKPLKESFNSTGLDGASGQLWAVAERCWSTLPQDRPNVVDIVAYLHPDRKVIGLDVRRRTRGARPVFFF